MKTVLVGINSKYIHSCLAIWYLKASIESKNDTHVVNREFTINDNKDSILSEIYKEKPDILTFSVYIWNIDMVLILSKEIKKLLPDCIVILGGPEVSYDAQYVMEHNGHIDFVLCGEGEETLPVLHKSIISGTHDYKKLRGIAFRQNGSVVFNEGFNLVANLDSIASPYSEELMQTLQNRIIYFEASRGCPFSCSYCISSTFNGIRFYSFERVKTDLDKLLEYKPRLIKFVDRTFNCNRDRAKEIFKYIIGLECDTVFHFEAAADLFDDEILNIVSKAKKGTLQFEIGIQTVNSQTLKEIDRVTNLDRLKANVDRILANGNIHVHLDLIAGLPYEDIQSFKHSFNTVYGMRPHQLQLGFLKLLKGSKVRQQADKHGYVFRDYSPYEILCNNYITYKDIIVLKDVEEVLERYYNSGRFSDSLDFMLLKLFDTPFQLFYELSVFCRESGYLNRPVSYRENIAILYEFVKNNLEYIKNNLDYLKNNAIETFRQNMLCDFLSSDSSCSVPECLRDDKNIVATNIIHEMLREDTFIQKYLPNLVGIRATNILKKVYFINVQLDDCDKMSLVLFDYTSRDAITERFRSIVVE